MRCPIASGPCNIGPPPLPTNQSKTRVQVVSHVFPENRPPLCRALSGSRILLARAMCVGSGRINRPGTHSTQADVARFGIVIEGVSSCSGNGQARRTVPAPTPMLLVGAAAARSESIRRLARRCGQIHLVAAATTVARIGMARGQAQFLLLQVCAGSVRVRTYARIPRLIRVETAEALAPARCGSIMSLFVCAGRSAIVAIPEHANSIVDPSLDAAWRRLRGTVGGGRGLFAEGDI